MTERARRWERHVRETSGVVALTERFAAEHGTTVLGGPLEGLAYPQDRLGEVDAPIAKLLGAYEAELHPILAEVIALRPTVFVDVGCADGYYAVGFARASPPTTVLAFETSKSARTICRELAQFNEVGRRLQLAGRASPESLARLPLAGSVVLSDCEGAEVDIFTAPLIRQLEFSLVIIELHEWVKPGCESVLRSRFSKSHSCEVVHAHARDAKGYPVLAGWSENERAIALNELRGSRESKWAIFRPDRGLVLRASRAAV